MKQIVQKFTNIVNKTILKVQNKTNSNFKISNFNKLLITFISLLFIYLFYLLIPTFYDKTWVQSRVEIKLYDEFKINISTSSDFVYRILPSPHFLIKDSKILLEDSEKIDSIANIKNLKVFINQNNFFDKDNVKIKKVIINQANFSLKKDTIKLLNESSNNKFSNKKIKINNSNIFFKDSSDETISIVKIYKSELYFDDKKLLNLFNLKGEIFKVPFSFNLKNTTDTLKNRKINISAKSLNLNIFDNATEIKKDSTSGENVISFLNSKINTKYTVKEKLINFESGISKIKNSEINYKGQIVTNPFDLNLNVDLNDYKLSKLKKAILILIEIARTELLFNENISANTSINMHSNAREDFFQDLAINFNIVNGKINFNNTLLTKKDILSLKLDNSALFFEDNKLTLNTDVKIIIKDIKPLYSMLQTNKKHRKEIKNVFINLDYDFLYNKIRFNKIMVDNNNVGNQFLDIIDEFDETNINNLIKSRRVFNKLFSVYEG
jgi:hypothetical protein|tara:strand:- start:1189 stop:2673 length:1485 start_codon:yes stop_codon:yes gene_type:complete